ncbi:MAG TPA: hypothetical protein VHN59_17450 [Chitinophagaceae bacterium]|nr:hypothetical protein [Chitinophagaceae bacterium]
MKNFLIIILALSVFTSCYKVSDEKGFISDNIYLKGADTIMVPLGGKGNTDVAWLDGSSMPATFSIENVRDANGNRSEQFFTLYPYKTWNKPYNNKTDTTIALINAKLTEQQLPAVSINPVNGMLQYLETTSNLKNAGDVYHVDVKVANSKGDRLVKDYAVLKLTSEKKPYTFYQAATAILLVNAGGQTTFTLYDNIPEDALDRHQNIYSRNGKELVDIYKQSNEPTTGIKVIIKYLDAEGAVFASKDYATYATGTESYFDYSVNRQNTPEGAVVEFPVTPFPARQDLLSYLKGGTMDFTKLDTASLHTEVYGQNKWPFLNPWPDDSWGASRWYIRLRSKVVFNESGTWVIAARFPYTHLDGTF